MEELLKLIVDEDVANSTRLQELVNEPQVRRISMFFLSAREGLGPLLVLDEDVSQVHVGPELMARVRRAAPRPPC